LPFAVTTRWRIPLCLIRAQAALAVAFGATVTTLSLIISTIRASGSFTTLVDALGVLFMSSI
jgi:hypothetical protein